MRVAGKMGRSRGVSHRLGDTLIWRSRATYSGDLVGTEDIVRSRTDVRGGITLFVVEHSTLTGNVCQCHRADVELAPAQPARHIRAPPQPAAVCPAHPGRVLRSLEPAARAVANLAQPAWMRRGFSVAVHSGSSALATAGLPDEVGHPFG